MQREKGMTNQPSWDSPVRVHIKQMGTGDNNEERDSRPTEVVSPVGAYDPLKPSQNN